MMPYFVTNKTCSRCQETNKPFRYRWHGQNKTHLFVSICQDCERSNTRNHQQNNREYWRAANKKSYLKWSTDMRQRRLLASHNRHKRLKPVKWDQELTELTTIEAHSLRGLRNKMTGIKWHVDHIIPLNGRNVSGLHVWNNLQVIPAVLNLSKGNKEMINRHS